jgi:hypothetical protein
MYKVFWRCNGGDYYSGRNCPFDGWSRPELQRLFDVVAEMNKNAEPISISALRGKGFDTDVSTRKTSGKADSGEAVQCGAKTKTAREPASLTSQGVSRMASRPPEDAALITVGFSVGVVSINRLHFILWSFGRAGD